MIVDIIIYIDSEEGERACVVKHNVLGEQSEQLYYTNNSSQKSTKCNELDLIFLKCWMQDTFELCRWQLCHLSSNRSLHIKSLLCVFVRHVDNTWDFVQNLLCNILLHLQILV
jgi:hypothetical protein